jgi:membrane-associated protease RseP (regulator of RpoE activity)
MGLPPPSSYGSPDPDANHTNPYAPPALPPHLLEPGEFWRREPKLRYIVLLLLTLLTTTEAGARFYGGFAFGFAGAAQLEISGTELMLNGFWYSLPVLAILGAHEFGHYLACVYYRVNASLPYFLPLPLFLTGTLGAVIRIRQPIPGKRALFDIGIAGPIAGFVVTVPAMLLGMMLSRVDALPPNFRADVIEFGEPLLLKFMSWFVFGTIGDNEALVLHPLGYAAWFGMLATALNLFPIGQLDGGHISYAVFGRRSTVISLISALGLVALTVIVSYSWAVWTVLTVVMLLVIGPHHPRVWDEEVPLDRTRVWLGGFALFMFIVCLAPTLVEFDVLVGTR